MDHFWGMIHAKKKYVWRSISFHDGSARARNGVRLEAEMHGEVFNPERHPQKLGVKAITYHLMEIEKKQDKTTLKFILDV